MRRLRKKMRKWAPASNTCAGCDASYKHTYNLVAFRYAGHRVQVCMGRGSTPKVGCVQRLAARSRLCAGCGRGEMVAADVAHHWDLYYSDSGTRGVRPGGLCESCTDALVRGREARAADGEDEKRREETGSLVWILRAVHFKGYAHALAWALTAGATWDAGAPSAPAGEDVREVSCGYRMEPGDVKLESPQLDPEAVWALKLDLDALLVRAERKGYRHGNSLLGHLAAGRYTAPGYDDAQERAEDAYDRRLERDGG